MTTPTPSRHVFTYGSLMFEPVWRRVVSGNYRKVSAVLTGFRRHPVKRASYPALIALDTQDAADAPANARGPMASPLTGVLYLDVDEADLRLLDIFEGSDYRRIDVIVTAADPAGRATPFTAQTYLFLDRDLVESGEWSPGGFESEHLERFLAEHAPRVT